MKHELIFEEGTIQSFQERICHYDNISISLCDRFENQFWENVERIKEFPLHFQVRYRDVRICFLRDFPISIHFIFEGSIVYVVKVLHTSQEF